MARRKSKSVQASTTRRINVQVDDEAYEALMIHSFKARMTLGELVQALAKENLKDWHLRANPKRGAVDLGDRLEIPGPVNQTAAA